MLFAWHNVIGEEVEVEGGGERKKIRDNGWRETLERSINKSNLHANFESANSIATMVDYRTSE